MSASFYDAMAPWYDLEFDDFDADLELYRGYAEIVGGPILELGCGTGRLLIPLALDGFAVTGVDTSADMLVRAERRAQASALDNVELRTLDMRALGQFPAAHFRMVFCAVNSFLHLETRADQLLALTAAHRVLHRSGLFIVDLFHPTPSVLQAMDDRLTLDGSWLTEDGSRLDRFSQRHVFPARQRIDTTLILDETGTDGVVKRSVVSYRTRYVHHFEMLGLLDEAGFEIEGTYGSYDLDPLDDGSPQMIFVAHAR
jgi:SAM-dependent methyltransferase